jgi:tRNA threonylcarbamoyladenosine biosynthesis protein TsaB
MIAINTLEVIALSCINEVKNREALYCPMIDARRMEVFTAVYNADLTVKLAPCSMILDEGSFKDVLKSDMIFFSGNGALKAKALFNESNAIFATKEISPDAMAQLSDRHFECKVFANVMSSAPLYIKEFHTIPSPIKT